MKKAQKENITREQNPTHFSFVLLGSIIIVFISYFLFYYLKITSERNKRDTLMISNQSFKLTSPAFGESETISLKYTCDGENVNPPLIIEGVPQNTSSLALVFDDPDAPLGIFTHWMVWNIKPKTNEIKENSVPEFAVQGINDWGGEKYGGPCPPSGEHRYIMTLYALDAGFGTPANKTRDDFNRAIKGHIVSETRLMGRYKRDGSF